MNNGDLLKEFQRFNMYKEMKSVEPRVWRKEHHLARLFTTIFAVNSSLYLMFKIYYRYYNPSLGFFESLIACHRMKMAFGLIIAIDYSAYLFNRDWLHQKVYSDYYSSLSDVDYYAMYESLIKMTKMKEINK